MSNCIERHGKGWRFCLRIPPEFSGRNTAVGENLYGCPQIGSLESKPIRFRQVHNSAINPNRYL